MAIALDNRSNSGEKTSVSSVTQAHTTGSLTNGAIFVRTATRGGSLAAISISSITYNGVALSYIRSWDYADVDAGRLRVEIWGKAAPASGTNNAVVTYGGTVTRTVVDVITLSEVDQTNITEASNGSFATGKSSPLSTSVTTVTDNAWVLDSVYSKTGGAISVGSGQTQDTNVPVNGGGDQVGMSHKGPVSPAGSTSMSWTYSAADDYAQVVVVVKPIVTTTRTQTGKSRVTSTTTKTQTGKARITTTTTQTQTGKARITATTTKTQTGVANIRNTITRTQTGLSRVTATTINTQTGISRVTAQTTQTQTGKARITATTIKTQAGVADIQVTTTRTQQGNSRIQQTVQKTQTGVSRIGLITQQTQTGKARITATTTTTHQGVANIRNTTNRTQQGTANIRNTTTQTQPGTSRITQTSTQTQTGKARITVTASQAQDGKSRITATTTQIQTGKSRLTATTTQTQSGVANIAAPATTTQDQTGKALITATTSQTQMGKARITATTQKTQTGKSRIANTISSDTYAGQALLFPTNNTGGRISVTNNAALNNLTAFTFEMWVYFTNIQQAYTIRLADKNAATNKGFSITISPNSQSMSALVGNGTTQVSTSSGTLPLLQKTHIALTWDGSKVRFFIGGTKVGSDVTLSGGDTGDDGGALIIGNRGIGDREFSGTIDEVRYSSVARYTANFTPPSDAFTNDTDTILLLHLDEGQGTSLTDSSSNSLTASITGSTLPTWTTGFFSPAGFPHTGKARITATTSQTQAGKASILNAVTQTQTGKSRITQTTTKTQTGVSRVSITTTQTQQGTARVTGGTSQDQTGKSRITATTSQTQAGKASIRRTTTQDQTGKSRIGYITTKTQTGVANIAGTTTRTQTGVATLGSSVPQTQTGKSRVTATSTQIQAGKSAIRWTTTQTQTGKARIQQIVNGFYYQDFAGNARPADWQEYGNSTWSYSAGAVTETSVGSNDPNKVLYLKDFGQQIIVQATLTVQAVGFNDDRFGITILGDSADVGRGINLNIRNSNALQFLDDAIAWGPSTSLTVNVGDVWILKGMYQGGVFYGKAWKDGQVEPDWMITWTRTPQSRYKYPGITGNSASKPARAIYDDFYVVALPSVQGRARITATTTQTQTGKARITRTTTQTQAGVSRITQSASQTQTGKARVTASSVQAQTGVSRVTATTIRTQTGNARIEQVTIRTQTGVSRIALITTRTQQGISRVTHVTAQTTTGTAKIFVPLRNPICPPGSGTSTAILQAVMGGASAAKMRAAGSGKSAAKLNAPTGPKTAATLTVTGAGSAKAKLNAPTKGKASSC